MSDPLAYLITFRTYGTWLHGDARGSVDRDHNAYESPMLPPNAGLALAEAAQLQHAAIVLSEAHRATVAEAIERICHDRGWTLSALNVRTNHVHAVVAAPDPPERVMHAMKSFATRRLREMRLVGEDRRLWSRHGSTRYLWKPREVQEACRYVVESQGDELGGEL